MQSEISDNLLKSSSEKEIFPDLWFLNKISTLGISSDIFNPIIKSVDDVNSNNRDNNNLMKKNNRYKKNIFFYTKNKKTYMFYYFFLHHTKHVIFTR